MGDQAATEGSRSTSALMLSRGALYTVATAAPVASGALFTPFTTRLLGPREYGVAATCVVITQIGSLVLPLGLPAAVTRQVILERSGAAGGRSLLVRGLVLTVLLTVVLAIGSPAWAPALLAHDWRISALWASLAGAGLGGVALAQAYLRGVDRVAAFTVVAASASLLGQGLGLVGAVVGRSADDYLLGLLVGYAAAASLGAVMSLRDGQPVHLPRQLHDALRIGLPTVPHQVATYLASGALILVAGHVLGSAGAGRLQVALLVGSLPSLLITSMNNSWAPTIYRAPRDQRPALLQQTSTQLAWLMALTSVGVAALSPWVLQIVSPPSFRPHDLLLPVALTTWVGTLAVAYLANVHLIFAEGRSTALAVSTPVSLAIALVAAVVLGRAWALAGVAVGLPAFYVSQGLLVRRISRRVSATRWSMRRVLPPVVLGGAVAVGTAAVPTQGAGSLARAGLVAAAIASIVVMGYRTWQR